MLKQVKTNIKNRRAAAAIQEALAEGEAMKERIQSANLHFLESKLDYEPAMGEWEETEYIPPSGYAVVAFGLFGLTVYDEKEIYTDLFEANKRAKELSGPHTVLPIF